MSKQIAVRIPDEIYQRLQILAEQTGRTATFYVREAVMEYIDDFEDIYLAENILEKLRRGEDRTHSLEEVEQELGLVN
jgi:RHH-type transcriptional regulator, rel operon repressor / antitoxin RelB